MSSILVPLFLLLVFYTHPTCTSYAPFLFLGYAVLFTVFYFRYFFT